MDMTIVAILLAPFYVFVILGTAYTVMYFIDVARHELNASKSGKE